MTKNVLDKETMAKSLMCENMSVDIGQYYV